LFQVSDHAVGLQQPQHFPPRGGHPLPGMTALPQPPQQNQMMNNIPGNTDTVIFKPEGRGQSHISGLGQQQRGPLPTQPTYDGGDSYPPPPPVRPMNGNGSADVSLNDSASTTQSNVTSECSEAECDREPLVKGGNRGTLTKKFNKNQIQFLKNLFYIFFSFYGFSQGYDNRRNAKVVGT
jgi:hypothetical protein